MFEIWTGSGFAFVIDNTDASYTEIIATFGKIARMVQKVDTDSLEVAERYARMNGFLTKKEEPVTVVEVDE
jgi:hypothetical protein